MKRFCGQAGYDLKLANDGVLEFRVSYSDVDLEEDWDQSVVFENNNNFSSELATYHIGRDSADIIPDNPAAFANPALYAIKTDKETFNQDDDLEDALSSFRFNYLFNTQENALGWGLKTGLWWRQLDRNFDHAVERFTGAPYTLADNNPTITTVDPNTPTFIDREAYWAFNREFGTRRVPLDNNVDADYELTEDVTAGYFMLRHATVQMKVHAGVRVEHTSFENRNYRYVQDRTIDPITFELIDNSFTEPLDSSKSYTNWLPNLHVEYSPSDPWKLRFALTRTLARPDFELFAMGRTEIPDRNDLFIQESDPTIDPRVSDNVDVSIERYFPDIDGYVSLGLFTKDIDNEAFREQAKFTNTAGGITTIERANNNGSANVKGLEFSVVIDRFEFFPEPFDGLGMYANYTYLDAEWDVVLSDGTRRAVPGLRNQPKQMLNASLFYDWGDWNASVAYLWRDRAFRGFGETAQLDEWVDVYHRVDVSVGYQLTDALEVTGFVRNATDSDYVYLTGRDRDRFLRHFSQGPSYWVGFKYKH